MATATISPSSSIKPSIFTLSPKSTKVSCFINNCKIVHPPRGGIFSRATLNGAACSTIDDFDPRIPIEEAVTPPSSWYTEQSFLDIELERVFYRGWQAVGVTDQIKSPHDFFTGRLGNIEFVVCRDDSGKVHAFHNVCRHHASLLAGGSGRKSCFVCPYHGWTYGLNGALLKATRIKGIKNFNVNEFGLVPIKVATWGPFVILNFEGDVSSQLEVDGDAVSSEWLGNCSDILSTNGVTDSSLSYICRREYTIECNWKVFCDNYLDGGYHVPYAHKGLASNLKLDSYSTCKLPCTFYGCADTRSVSLVKKAPKLGNPVIVLEIYEKLSIQWCEGGTADSQDDYDRLGAKALYAFIYPNFMINRYGPWMDTNLVLPLGPRKCKVIFDYFLEAHLKDDRDFIDKSLQDSERVQIEDVMLCEGVQRGLESPAYCKGRYAPTVENAMHHFHCLLNTDLKK